MKYAAIGLISWVVLCAGVVQAAPPSDPSQNRANQTFDAGVYRIFFTAPYWGQELSVSSPVEFTFFVTGGFILDRDLACPAGTCYGKEPQFRLDDTGHCHVYVEDMNTKTRVAFSASCASPVVFNSLSAGDYCAYIDLTHNDHVARFKPGPQDLPAFDKVCFTIVE